MRRNADTNTTLPVFQVGDRIEWQPTNSFIKSGEVVAVVSQRIYRVQYESDGQSGTCCIEVDATTRKI